MNNLDVILCDEGHRLKNVQGTKTSTPLNHCIATLRIVLTGTPIQNNLEELFAVVDFVAPGHLGSLREFKAEFSDPIMEGREVSASDRKKKMVRFCAVCQKKY